MTLEQAKLILKKAQNKEPMTAEESSKIHEAYKMVMTTVFKLPGVQ